MKNIPLDSPGLILQEEFMGPYNITPYKLCKETGIDKMTLSGILNEKKRITPKVALKISKFFGMSDRFFINLQSDYDVRILKKEIKSDLDSIKRFEVAC